MDSLECLGDRVAYVMQDDILFGSLRVWEALMFSADLRLAGVRREEKVERVG